MNRDSSHQTSTPWYKIPIVWLMIALPASSVVLGAALLIIAVKNADDVVADDWYKQGRTINRNLDNEAVAQRFGLAVTFELHSDKTHAQLSAKTPIAWPEQLQLALRHPAFAKEDKVLALAHQGEGHYIGEAIHYNGHDAIVTITPIDNYWRLQHRVSLSSGKATVKAQETQ